MRLVGRLLSVGIVIAAAVMVWPALQRQRELQERLLAEAERAESAPVPWPADPEPPADPPAAGDEADPAEREPRTYWRYVDAGGSIHFVESLERVPEAARDGAKPITLARESGQRAEPTADRAPAARRRPRAARPFERVASSPAPRRPAAAADVVVYTTSWCGWCRKTLAWLDARGVEYENRDIERRAAWRDELIEKTGSTSIPVVEIDGELVRGFDPARMDAML